MSFILPFSKQIITLEKEWTCSLNKLDRHYRYHFINDYYQIVTKKKDIPQIYSWGGEEEQVFGIKIETYLKTNKIDIDKFVFPVNTIFLISSFEIGGNNRYWLDLKIDHIPDIKLKYKIYRISLSSYQDIESLPFDVTKSRFMTSL